MENAKSVESLFRVRVVVQLGIALLSQISGGCLGPESVRCGEHFCKEGEECDPIHGECVLPEQRVVCQGKPDGSPCTIGGDDRYLCDLGVCLPWRCGDGLRSPGEECDDGNQDDHDSCRNICRWAICGDGVQHVGSEDCDGDDFGGITCADLGFSGGTLICLANCVFDRSGCVNGCGNGIVDSGEECDEGLNNSDIAPDGCRSDCRQAWCGDGVVDAGEGCDDGPTNSNSVPDACRSDCQQAWCGDGVVDAGEGCDSGPDNSNIAPDACRSECRQAWCGDGVVDAGEGCDDSNSTPWDGCNSCSIAEIQANTSSSGSQAYPVVASADDGRFVVAWMSNDDIVAQRFDAQGSPADGELQINTYTNGAQLRPALAMASDGGFVVAWESDDPLHHGIYARRFDAQGNPLGGDIQANSTATGELWFPAVAMAYDGRFIVVWGNQDQSAYGIFAQRFDALGSPVGAEFQVNTTMLGWQHLPSVAMAGDGHFVVAWFSHELDGSDYGVAAQRYNNLGIPLGGEFQVNTYEIGNQSWPAVTVADDGRFVVAWSSDGQDGDQEGVYAQSFDAQGDPTSIEFRVNIYLNDNQEQPSAAMANDGSLVIVWQSYGQDGDQEGVYARLYNAQGSPAGGEFQLNTYTSGTQAYPSVAMAGDGSFVVVWHSDGQDGSGYGIFFQRFDAQGNALGAG